MIILAIFWFLIFSTPSVASELNWNDRNAQIPVEAKSVQCVGSAARKICVGDDMYLPFNTFGHPIYYWRSQDRRRVTEVWEFNAGKTACWFEYAGNKIGSIRCVGLR